MAIPRRTIRLGLLMVLALASIGVVPSAVLGKTATPSSAGVLKEEPMSRVRSFAFGPALSSLVGQPQESPAPSLAQVRANALGALGITATTTVFSDGFEGAAPPWQVSGYPGWGGTTYRAYAGQWSAYCAENGIGAPGPYANYMHTGLRAGPFNLSSATSATLSYKLYLKSETGYDDFGCLISTDGSNYYGWGSSGDSQGWITQTRDLTAVPTLGNVCGQSQVWIVFSFDSDVSGTMEGAYLDDVRLLAQVPVPAPLVADITPTSGPVGTSVTVTGSGFTGATAVQFNGTPSAFSVTSDSRIAATVPAGATSGTVAVTTAAGTGSSAGAFTVTVPAPAAPAITSFIPASGVVGTSVTLTGTGFSGATAVTFNGAPAPFLVNSAAQITATVPAGATTGTIAVTTPAGTGTSASSFTVTSPPPPQPAKPSINRLSPTSGKRGVLVTITGSRFGASRGTSAVRFGTKACTKYVSWSNTRIRCRVAARATFGTVKVTVRTKFGTSNAKSFRVKR